MTDAEVTTLKGQRGALRTQITKFAKEIDDLTKDPARYNEIQLVALKDKGDRYSINLKTINDKIVSLLPRDESDKEYDKILEYEDRLCDAVSRVGAMINIVSRQANTAMQVPATSQQLVNTTEKIKINTFSGRIDQYESFIQQFRSSIDSKQYYSEVDKFNYLFNYVQGEARECISGLEITADNYKTALRLLEKSFGDKKALQKSHLDALLEIKAVNIHTEGRTLKKLVNSIQVHVRAYWQR